MQAKVFLIAVAFVASAKADGKWLFIISGLEFVLDHLSATYEPEIRCEF